MTTRQAFQLMINEKGIQELLSITAQQLYTIRRDLKRNKVSLDLMEDLLIRAGWTKEPEQWKKI